MGKKPRCRKCRAKKCKRQHLAHLTRYKCGSLEHLDGYLERSHWCMWKVQKRRAKSAEKEVERLRKGLVGFTTTTHNPPD